MKALVAPKGHRKLGGMRLIATALRIHPPAKQGVSKSPAGLYELCFIRSIQSMTAVIEIFANRQKASRRSATTVDENFSNRRNASRRSMPTGVELCFIRSIQSTIKVDSTLPLRDST